MLSPVYPRFSAARSATARTPKRRLSAPPPAATPKTRAADKEPAPPLPPPRQHGAADLTRALFAIDLRSLALFRISLALMLLADLAMRAWDLEAFYTDFGLLPRVVAPSTWNGGHLWSLHLQTGTVAGEAFLFLVATVFAILLLVGWQTRVFTFLSWVMLISLHSRNPLILQGGDVLLRMLLFWGMFLPLGAFFSLDAARDRRKRAAREVKGETLRPLPAYTLSVASAGLLLQVAFVYWFSAALKTDASWRTTGTAIDIALRLDQFVTPMGKLLRQIPLVPRGLTFATFFIETLGPALAFLPVRTGPVRAFVVAAFWAFHLIGLNVCLELGPFPYICTIAWMAFLPAWFWDHLAPRLVAPARRYPRLVAGWSRLAARLGESEGFYAPNRTGRLTQSWPGHAVAAFFLGYILLWNLRTVNWDLWSRVLPYTSNPIGEAVHVDQSWGMFAPKPMTDDGWMVIPGKLRDGTTVDVFHDAFAAPSYAKPVNYAQSFRDERWRKYLNNLWSKANAPYRLEYGRYLCRRWNRANAGADGRGPRQLLTFQMYYMMEMTRPDLSEAPPVKTLMWDHCCLDDGCGGAAPTRPAAPPTPPKMISIPVTVTPLGPNGNAP